MKNLRPVTDGPSADLRVVAPDEKPTSTPCSGCAKRKKMLRVLAERRKEVKSLQAQIKMMAQNFMRQLEAKERERERMLAGLRREATAHLDRRADHTGRKEVTGRLR